MNVKNFIVGGIVGGIVDFLLGWVVYGMLLHDMMPMEPGAKENMLHIFLGCMSFGFLISWVFSQGEGISNVGAGIKMAIGIALFMGLCSHFFMNMTSDTIDCKYMAIDILGSFVLAAGVGAAVATVNGKMK
ncbi:hypothetical protein [Flavobacterium wongokense]|uniref:hypothetical protein n=1 Tax=Flavobacterium wongokense TaxID=2910674 RepID=UPI001F1A75A6|nr:hypothetical protein [Flavobacterium sp. WG47]MCF6132486.1 hypothetical protein [Flavobacterium sp. WG47]